MYQKKTLRRMPATTRKFAKSVNEFEKLLRQMKKSVEYMHHLEIDSLALFEQNKHNGPGEVKNKEGEDWLQESILSKVTQ